LPLVFAVVIVFAVQLEAADSSTVGFSLDFPTSSPEHYSFAVQSDGQTHYESSGRISLESDERTDYQTDFTFSEATRARIFALAARAHYFSGRIDSGNKKLAFTGTKELTYKDGQRNTAAKYNFSTVPAVQQLTTLFQDVSTTLEYGRRLSFYHQYQKLALDDELKHMEDQARHGELAEIQAVRPVLEQIYEDSSVINFVRARAERIMEMRPAPVPGG